MKKIVKFLIFMGVIVVMVISGLSVYTYVCIQELEPNLLSNKTLLGNFDTKLNFYDNRDILLEQTSANGKAITKLEELSDWTKNAFIAIEDKGFYQHNGLNFKRILKASFDNITNGYAKQGASTISQQLIKNTHLTRDKTLKRKIQEAYLTTKLENKYSKNDILETYLNVIYFGNGAIGIERAAQTFFNCSASELNLAQSATLAGLIKSPSYYSPINNLENCLNRRNLVLKEMLKENYISQQQYSESVNSGEQLSLQHSLVNANCFYQHTIQEAQKILDLSEKDVALSNYKIYTYLDSNLQSSLADGFQNIIYKNSSNKKIDSVLVVLDNKTLGIKALVSTSNNADIKRQPGSLIKPILCYAPAFDMGILSPISPLNDSTIKFGDWTPSNVDGRTDGWITTRQSLYQSKNIPAVKVLEYVGLEKAKKYATQLGIDFEEEDNHLALSLGAMQYGVSPLQMAAAYANFANSGNYGDYKLIRKIENLSGQVVYEDQLSRQQVFNEETAFLINDTLEDCVRLGTAKKLNSLPITLSAKTGTVGAKENNQNTDAWCVSYNTQYTLCAWAGNLSGNTQNNLSKEQNGGTLGANLNKIVWQALNLEEDIKFKKPDSIKSIKVDYLDWKEKHIVNLASEKTPDRYTLTDFCSERYLPQTTGSRFVKVASPTLSVKKEQSNAILTWNSERFLKYDVYENGELYDKDCSSPYSIPVSEGRIDYFIVARNQFSGAEAKSDLVTLYIKKEKVEKNKQKAEQNFVKKVARHWLFN